VYTNLVGAGCRTLRRVVETECLRPFFPVGKRVKTNGHVPPALSTGSWQILSALAKSTSGGLGYKPAVAESILPTTSLSGTVHQASAAESIRL